MGKQQEGEDRCTYVYMYVCRFMSVDDEVYVRSKIWKD